MTTLPTPMIILCILGALAIIELLANAAIALHKRITGR